MLPVECSYSLPRQPTVKRRPFPLTATDSWVPLVEKVIPVTCQSASVFSRHHNNPVPLDCDRGSSTGQIGNVCDSDDHDVAGSLRNQSKKLELIRKLNFFFFNFSVIHKK